MALTLELSTGQKMPMLGLGTWHHHDQEDMSKALKHAISIGYRHIDCAYIYLNEKQMGSTLQEVLNQGTVTREELFIVSKLWGTEHAKDRVEAACRATLADLRLSYLDLYLVHWPTGFVPDNGNVPLDSNRRTMYSGVSLEETWEAMERLVDLGLVKAIGVCNYNSQQLTRISSMRIKPSVLQVESNPRFGNERLRKFCAKNGIKMVAYSPFGSPDLVWGEKLPHILTNPILKSIGEKHGKTTANVVLRWQVQRGVGFIPKSIIFSELENNQQIWDFQLTEADMEAIGTLETGKRLIIPVVKQEDGSNRLRDGDDINFPFHYTEPLE